MRTTTAVRPVRARRRGERGIALVLALFALMALMVTASTGLLVGTAGVKATRNYRGASQVHFVAESAISEALQLINGPGVVHFQNDVVNHWGAIYGSSARPFAPLGGFTYTLAPIATVGNEGDAGRLVATANGPEGFRNVVVANVIRSDVPSTSPGAVYLASNAQTDATFTGNGFLLDGNDRNPDGTAGPGAPVPGLSTRTDANTQEAISSLNNSQLDNVTGLGFSAGPPTVPSLMTAPAGPSPEHINQIVEDLLDLGVHVEISDDQVNGGSIFGSPEAPQITYFSNGAVVKGNGNSSGAGIMIVEGDLEIQGNFEFQGLILVRGQTTVTADPETQVTGNATVYGSIWTNDFNLVVGGSAIVQYSTQALAYANQVGGGGALPAPMRVVSLADCAMVPSGVGGCP